MKDWTKSGNEPDDSDVNRQVKKKQTIFRQLLCKPGQQTNPKFREVKREREDDFCVRNAHIVDAVQGAPIPTWRFTAEADEVGSSIHSRRLWDFF